MSKKQAVIDASGKIDLEDLQQALTLSPAVERRVHALMNLHDKYIEVNKKYQEEVRALERKYAEQYKPLFEKREAIAVGKYEPTDEEAKYGDDEEEGAKKEVKKEDKKEEKGIPGFWLQAMQNNSTVGNFIFDNDNEALEFLTDIRASTFENGEEGSGYELTFHFAENPYFSNTVLTKKYFLELDDMFGEYNLDHSEGCKIDWKAGKNLTVKTVKKQVKAKKGKGAAKGGARSMTVEEPQESFFNFFTPPQPEEKDEEDDEEEEEDENAGLVEMDFDIGNRIRDTIVPFAVLWFTGDAADFDEDDFGEYPFGMGEDDDEDEEEEEEEEEEEPKGRGGRGGGAGGKGGKGGQQGHQFQPPKTGSNIPQPQQPECKQQ